jgi:hypothetical protein
VTAALVSACARLSAAFLSLAANPHRLTVLARSDDRIVPNLALGSGGPGTGIGH